MNREANVPADQFDALVETFAGAPDVTLPTEDPTAKRGFGSSALKVKDKIFAMLVRGSLVLKLPKARVDELIAAGQGDRFDPGHGRLMKEWVVIAEGSGDWLALAREARKFVGA